jgi:hypothetical protein
MCFHPSLPGKLQIPSHIRRIAPPHITEQGRRSHTEPRIISPLPVRNIMTARKPGKRIIRYLITPISRFSQNLLRPPIHHPILILRGKRQPPGLRPIPSFPIILKKRSPFLYNKTISGNMLRFQPNHLLKRLRPPLRTLPRKHAHQIHINITKPFLPRHLITAKKILPGMNPPQSLQFPIIRRLQPHTEPVHPRQPIPRKTLPRHSPGIHLHSNLHPVPTERKLLPQTIHDNTNLFSGKQRRRASAKKYSPHLMPSVKRRLRPNFPYQSLDIFSFHLIITGSRKKITIKTFANAKRNM